MNNAAQAFNYDSSILRTVIDNGVPGFIAKDACQILGIENHNQAIEDVPNEWRKMVTVETAGGLQTMAAITEPGLYLLIFRSRKPAAAAVRKWVCEEVLPQIRQTGSYHSGVGSPEEKPFSKDFNWCRLFELAKTGQVQMALLSMLGVQVPATARAEKGDKNPVFQEKLLSPDKIFRDMETFLLVAEDVSVYGAFRVSKVEKGMLLLFMPEPVINGIMQVDPVGYAGVTRQMMLKSMQQDNSFIRAKLISRYRWSEMAPVLSWGFLVTSNSHESLQSVVRLLQLKQAAEAP